MSTAMPIPAATAITPRPDRRIDRFYLNFPAQFAIHFRELTLRRAAIESHLNDLGQMECLAVGTLRNLLAAAETIRDD